MSNKAIQELPFWAAEYIGITFEDQGRTREGCDCWGLVMLIYKEQFGIHLTSFIDEYQSANNAQQIAEIIEREETVWHRTKSPELGDVAVCKIKGTPWHTGLMLTSTEMLHVSQKAESIIEKVNSLLWQNRIWGYFRHV